MELGMVSWGFVGLYSILAIGWFYSENGEVALNIMEKQLVFLLFPFLLPNIPILWFKLLFTGFSFSLAALFFLFLFAVGFHISPLYWFQNLPLHYPYFGHYAALSSLFCLHFWFETRGEPSAKKQLTLAPFFLFVGLTLCSASRNAQIFLILGVFISLSLNLVRQKPIYALLLIMLFLASIYFVVHLPRFSNWQEALLIKKMSWNCSLEPISGYIQWIFGVGPGDAQHEIQECYFRYQSWFYDYRYNSHNQYLTYLISSGLLGFMLFGAILSIGLVKAFRSQYQFLLFLFGSCLVASLSESVFLVNKGIVFFAFWLVLADKAISFRSQSKNQF